MTPEFNLIKKYFTLPTSKTELGIGDDAALIQPTAGHQLVISTDMSVAGIHFLENAAPYSIGWKSLAVNVSDMAAMGAQPKWTTLSLALPNIDDAWLSEFARGFFACAEQFSIDLIGGDTTRGPLNIAIQIMGEAPVGKALKRSNAQADDDIWVSGYLGSAAHGFAHLQQKQTIDDKETLQTCLTALNTPAPRIDLGIALGEIAHSCIDISDGLLADLSHILTASNLGATVNLEAIPCLPYLKSHSDEAAIQQTVLTGGDDYELCFTAASNMSGAIIALSKTLDLSLTKIGKINTSDKLSVLHHNEPLNLSQLGYDHFSN